MTEPAEAASQEPLRGFRRLMPFLKLAAEKRASDIYFTVGSPAMMRIEGAMHPVGRQDLLAEVIEGMADAIMTDVQRREFEQRQQVDLATQAGGLGRFRVNVFRQRGDVAMVMRFVGADIPGIDALGLPPVLKDLAMQKRGLVLLVGSTGSGKSTTLAAMIDHRNRSSAGHILTIEDPIEFVHPHRKSIVNQREVGIDVPSYEDALVAAMREAPDVVLVGEVRVQSTMQACVHLANTGQLALATLHANNAYQALQRIVNLYPGELREQLYLDLNLTLRAIVSQRLVKGADGRRIAACEVMLNTPFISELIVSGRIDEIREAMDQAREEGMQSFDQALAKLYQDGRISKDEALANADSRANLEAKLHFGG